MKNITRAALLAAGAAVVSANVVHAAPRADATTDPKALVASINAAFEEFKATHATETATNKAEVSAKLATISDNITAMTTALEKAQADLAKAQLGGDAGVAPEVAAHSSALLAYMRRGTDPGASAMRELEVAAKLTTQSDPDGGYLVPEEMEGAIDRVLGTVSAVRGLSRVIQISGQTYKRLVNQGGTNSGWTGENDARPETSTPMLREIAIHAHELYAQPAATQTALDDSRFNVEQWLAEEVSIEFAEEEGAAFVSGDGVSKPRGILGYDTVANADYAWGSVGFVTTGHATSFAAADPGTDLLPSDCLVGLYYALREGYRNGATFLTSDRVLGTIRKMKDGDGNYLWAPPQGEDGVPTILQKPVVTDDNMPALGAGAFPVAFGNFMRGYLIVDRQGIRVLRDPFTSKPNVLFYTTKRVGGGIQNFEAIKLLKVSA
jgi:HK97 family phage major capsid protein